jgi:protocatechuate 3,4-dioxygenase, alpha subunit
MQTPSQTSGPLFGFALLFDGSENAVLPGSPGAIRIGGQVMDGGGPLVYPDCFLEFWQGDQFARTRTDPEGGFHVVVRKPEAVATPDGDLQAPFLNVTLFARGLLKQAQTRLYFPDEVAANEEDPVLQLVPAEDRDTLIAVADGGGLRFDIHLQGDRETVFFTF